MEKTEHVYGRGKFATHPDYIAYMHRIVAHPNYAGMPNAISADGRINWQVSSGKTTSFYKDYLARRNWWIAKADALGLPGKNDENDRFTTAARLIHPTGYRVCRLCGRESNVGYFYLNSLLARRLNRIVSEAAFDKGVPISAAIEYAHSRPATGQRLLAELRHAFPERAATFDALGVTSDAFERTRHIRSAFLSPGFMGNPPDRLDGFHDYDINCRKSSDPGRSDENMRTYNHDRRSFEWWAEGDWALADSLYNSAGPGFCGVAGCLTPLKRVSPDHVGPLACGFKQLPLFTPTCPKHNSTKNRRFSLQDVRILIDYEQRSGESVASWQVRAHWDQYKQIVCDDRQTKALSNSLRSLQDFYLRTLGEVWKAGRVRLLASILHPEYALRDYDFVGLDPSMLTYQYVNVSERQTMMRQRLAARTVRIAFEALSEYCAKGLERRKMVRPDFDQNIELVLQTVSGLAANVDEADLAWCHALHGAADDIEVKISKLLVNSAVPTVDSDIKGRLALQQLFDFVGANSAVDFSRYDDSII